MGLIFGTSTAALVAHLALSYPSGRLRHRSARWVVVAGYAVLVGTVGLVGTTVFDPASIGCLDCPANLLMVRVGQGVAEAVGRVGVRLGAAWLLIAFAMTLWRVLSAGPEARGTVGPMGLAGVALLGSTRLLYLSSLSGALRTHGPVVTCCTVCPDLAPFLAVCTTYTECRPP